ncbi:MAG: hypothetical protein DDT25_00626 [Chloroflexi bacterium]|nr:hypothetical protein [Chloroflexota bacterium]
MVISTGKEAVIKALPPRAGLNMLCPRPPKASLTMAIENTDPAATIHNGIVGGRVNARRSPVTTALPSIMNGLFLNFLAPYSVSTAAATLTAITERAR